MVFISSNEFITFLTTEITNYLISPKEDKKLRKKQKKENQLNPSVKWFGLIPFALKTEFKIVK